MKERCRKYEGKMKKICTKIKEKGNDLLNVDRGTKKI